MLIGRSDKYKDIRPDIDLSPIDTNNSVSRIHAEIERVTDGLSITDKGSMNGTFVNGQWLREGESATLKVNDSVRFGRVKLMFTGTKLKQIY
jgi:pSer/pThr/pTyr-binding forkhead associated (FHA) protein